MSQESQVQIVQLGKIGRHPNADSLDITTVHGGYPCIIRRGDFNPGDRAVYIPVEMVVPLDDPQFAFLGKHNRIQAKKIRGIFSMGLLVPIPESLKDQPTGVDVSTDLGITKYEPPIEFGVDGECERGGNFMPCYTDIESARKYHSVLLDGEEVVCTEKIHGANFRACWHDGRLWVGSHNQVKREDDRNLFWAAAKQINLGERLRAAEDKVTFGEIFGYVQDLRYNLTSPGQFDVKFFDVFNIGTGAYMDYDNAEEVLSNCGLNSVPLLYRGPWKGREHIASFADGLSTIPNANCIREGLVVKPTKERWDQRVSRVILKYHGEDFLLRKQRQ